MIATRRAALLALGLALLAVTGCGDSRSDKAGGREQTTTVLHMANEIGGSEELTAFVREVTRRSGGTLRIDVTNSWRAGQRDYETRLIGDIKAGKADLAWVGSRAWSSVGVASFEALQAPFLIDSYELEQAVITAPMIAQMLSGVAGLGLVPLGVLPGPMRKPLGRAPLLRPADYAGKTIGVQNSRVAASTMRALGARPRWFPAAGRIEAFDGIEQQLTSIDGNGYEKVARYVSANVNLWPRPLVLFMNGAAFGRLSEQQQRALKGAVASAVPQNADLLVSRDAESARNICRRGAIFVSATREQLAALRSAVRPVYAQLEHAPQSRSFIAQIQRLKHTTPGAATPASAACKQRDAGGATASGQTPLTGTYTAVVTRAELLTSPVFEAGEDNRGNHGKFRLEFRDGRWKVTNLSIDGSSGGIYSVKGSTVTLHTATTGEVFVFRWSIYRDSLSFTKLSAGPTWFVVHPWRRLR